MLWCQCSASCSSCCSSISTRRLMSRQCPRLPRSLFEQPPATCRKERHTALSRTVTPLRPSGITEIRPSTAPDAPAPHFGARDKPGFLGRRRAWWDIRLEVHLVPGFREVVIRIAPSLCGIWSDGGTQKKMGPRLCMSYEPGFFLLMSGPRPVKIGDVCSSEYC